MPRRMPTKSPKEPPPQLDVKDVVKTLQTRWMIDPVTKKVYWASRLHHNGKEDLHGLLLELLSKHPYGSCGWILGYSKLRRDYYNGK